MLLNKPIKCKISWFSSYASLSLALMDSFESFRVVQLLFYCKCCGLHQQEHCSEHKCILATDWLHSLHSLNTKLLSTRMSWACGWETMGTPNSASAWRDSKAEETLQDLLEWTWPDNKLTLIRYWIEVGFVDKSYSRAIRIIDWMKFFAIQWEKRVDSG